MTHAELRALIDLIVRELAAVTARQPRTGERCACHATPADCCPDRLRAALDAGASRVGVKAIRGLPADVASVIDHTLLRPDASRRDIEALCREATELGFATVCINPTWVSLAARCVTGTPVGVCAVVGFPLGATTADVKAYEARRAIFDGATEIDAVINVGALKSGDLATVARELEALADLCRECRVLSKIILETSLLTDDEKVSVCTLSRAAGADYVKTSTGFGPGGATVADVALMRQAVGEAIGVKAAGGVRDLDAVRAMIAAGATRIGASAGVRIVREALGDRAADAGERRGSSSQV